MIHSSKFIQDKYGYNRVTSSYINGAVYDVSIIVCLSTGLVLVKTILYTVHPAKTFFSTFFLINNLLIWFDRWKCDIDIFSKWK